MGAAGYTYAAVLVGAALLWWDAAGHPFSRLGGLLLGLTLVLVGVLVRQVLAVHDADLATLALVEQQADLEKERTALASALRANVELSTGLERTVKQRTAELAARTQQLRRQAYLDPLTGLGNRLVLQERLAAATLQDWPCSLLMVDLDGFKEANDSLGHSTGDALLVAVAERLSAAAGNVLVVRLGGDEFAALVPAPVAEAEALGERMVQVLTPGFVVTGAHLSIGPSVRVTGCSSGDDLDPEVLLRDADCAMYHAKRAGKGRVATYVQGMHERVADRLRLQEELRQAVGTAQLFLEYQPLVELADGSTVGAEALVPWRHPTRGVLPPFSFIPLAEESGLIVQLGKQVLTEACKAAARWQARPGGDGVRVSVNVSLRQLADPDLLDSVRLALQHSDLPAHLLIVEITESVLAEDVAAASAVLAGLHGLGVRIALDDFGTGQSSLASLGRYPLDVLKIDKAFADDLVHSEQARRVAAAIVEMGQALGLTTCMEGVEHDDQAAVLTAMGCDVVQGYLYDRPLAETALLARLAGEQQAQAA